MDIMDAVEDKAAVFAEDFNPFPYLVIYLLRRSERQCLLRIDTADGNSILKAGSQDLPLLRAELSLLTDLLR